MKTLHSRFLIIPIVVASTLAVILSVLRIEGVISLQDPLQLITSGSEEESLFAIWKLINGDPIYTDRLAIPYNAVVYNWLFYDAYAFFISIVTGLLSLPDPWLPTIGRLFTLVAIVTGIWTLFSVYRGEFTKEERGAGLFCLAFSFYFMMGPLVGWWVISVRADIWALTFEIIGTVLFLRYYPERRLSAVLVFAIACYLAWSFKQTNIYALGSVGVFLMFKRQWALLALLITIMAVAWGATFLIGGSQYIENILLLDFTLIFDPWHSVQVLKNFIPKIVLILCVLIGAVVTIASDQGLRRAALLNNSFVLSFIAIIFCPAIAIPASSQTGGAESYYFTWAFFLSLAATAATGIVVSNRGWKKSPLLVGAGGAGGILGSLAIFLVLSGWVGATDVSHLNRIFNSQKQCLAGLPLPIYSVYSYMGLPWMTPGNIPFVVSFQYDNERLAGKKFESNGLGGLIAAGKIKTLALTVEKPASFDGASLKDYHPLGDIGSEKCRGIVVLLHKSVDRTELQHKFTR